MEHGVMSKLVGKRHECGPPPKPDGAVRRQRPPTVRLSRRDRGFTKEFDPRRPGALARTGIRRASCVELEPRKHNPKVGANSGCDRLDVLVTGGITIKNQQALGITGVLSNSCPVSPRWTWIDRCWRTQQWIRLLCVHGVTVSHPYDVVATGAALSNGQDASWVCPPSSAFRIPSASSPCAERSSFGVL